MDQTKPFSNAAKRIVSGEEFRLWRESRGLGLKQVAKQLGVTKAAVQGMDRVGLTRTQALALTACATGLEPLSFKPEHEESA